MIVQQIKNTQYLKSEQNQYQVIDNYNIFIMKNKSHEKISQKPKVLFSIKIKISADIIDISVLEGDTSDSLIQRVCTTNSISFDAKPYFETKIFEALTNLLKQQSVSSNLKIKIANFIKANKNEENKKALTPAISNIRPQEEDNEENRHFSRAKSTYQLNNKFYQQNIGKKQNQYVEPEFQSESKPYISKIQSQAYFDKPKINFDLPLHQNAPIQDSDYMFKPRRKYNEIDPQLLNAYRIVSEKSNIPELRQMTRKILQDQQLNNIMQKQLNLKKSRKHLGLGLGQVKIDNKENSLSPYRRPGGQFIQNNTQSFKYKPYERSSNSTILARQSQNFNQARYDVQSQIKLYKEQPRNNKDYPSQNYHKDLNLISAKRQRNQSSQNYKSKYQRGVQQQKSKEFTFKARDLYSQKLRLRDTSTEKSMIYNPNQKRRYQYLQENN